MKNAKIMELLLLGSLLLVACSKPVGTKQESNRGTSVELTTESVTSKSESATRKEEEGIDLTGSYSGADGGEAEIKQESVDKWVIAYTTSEGDVEGKFATDWQVSGNGYYSKTSMEKSDGYVEFEIAIQYNSPKDISLTMTDGVSSHDMTFSIGQVESASKIAEDAILSGDLSEFSGQLTTDSFNQQIADSGFTLGGYEPEDYYQNSTTVFPSISEDSYWNGITSHGLYELDTNDLSEKVADYYEVHFYGSNPGANGGQVDFYLVPANVTGPDDSVSSSKRVFLLTTDGETHYMPYLKVNWWETYQ